jgi:hypothetical protein
MVEREMEGETEALGENLTQRNVFHKSHTNLPDSVHGPLRWEAVD